MSYDIQAEALCDHKVHREIYLIDWTQDLDLRQIRLPYPMSNRDVRIWVNEYEIKSDDPKMGWSIVPNELSVAPEQLQKIVFKKPFKDYFQYVEVSYTSPIDFCRKCYGLGVLYDHFITRTGDVKKVDKEQKLIQHLIKNIMTILGSNPFHPYIGTRIAQAIFKALRNPQAFETQTLLDIENVFSKYKLNQYKQAEVQSVDLRELLSDLRDLNIVPNNLDPREYELYITATTQAGNTILVERELFAGDLFLSGPIREAGIR